MGTGNRFGEPDTCLRVSVAPALLLKVDASHLNFKQRLLSREGEAPMALPAEGATRAPVIAKDFTHGYRT
jgi:hypothetical protein